MEDASFSPPDTDIWSVRLEALFRRTLIFVPITRKPVVFQFSGNGISSSLWQLFRLLCTPLSVDICFVGNVRPWKLIHFSPQLRADVLLNALRHCRVVRRWAIHPPFIMSPNPSDDIFVDIILQHLPTGAGEPHWSACGWTSWATIACSRHLF